MTTTASSVIQRASDLLQDNSIHWKADELVRWLNDAQRAIVKVRPDALNITATMTLAAGPRQDLDDASLSPLPAKLIEITRNMAATSNMSAVTAVDRPLLDAISPYWYNATPSVNVQHFIFDPRDPKKFLVYPPATVLSQVELSYSAYPTDIAEPADGTTWVDVIGNLSLDDIFADDVLNMVLYRAFSKDSESAGNLTRSAAYFAAVKASLGDEIAATLAVKPTE